MKNFGKAGVWFGAAACAVLSWACGGKPTPTQDPFVAVQAKPASLVNDGMEVDVQVVAQDGFAQPGTGKVTLDVGVGTLGGAGKSIVLDLDSAGVAWTTYSCAVQTDPLCLGPVDVNASWAGVSGSTAVTGLGRLTVTAPPSAGADGGSAGMPPGQVLMYGNMVAGLNNFVAVSPLGDPREPGIGIGWSFVARLWATEAGVVFTRDAAGVLWRWVRDPPVAWRHGANTWDWPAVMNPDVPWAVPGCAPVDLQIRPDTNEVVTECATGEWRRASGVVVPAPASAPLFGPRGSLLRSESRTDGGVFWFVRSATGREVQVTGAHTLPNEPAYQASRAVDDGYYLFRGVRDGGLLDCSLSHTDLSGNFQEVGHYPEPALYDGGTPWPCGAQLANDSIATDRAGAVYYAVGVHQVVRRPLLPGVSTVVYNAKDFETWETTRIYFDSCGGVVAP